MAYGAVRPRVANVDEVRMPARQTNGETKKDVATGKVLATRILQQIAIRQQHRLAADFLRGLGRLPAGRYLTLCGSAALQGVYLHDRMVGGLDFLGPHIVALRLPETAAKAMSLRLEQRTDGYSFAVSDPRTSFPGTELLVKVFVQADCFSLPVERTFQVKEGVSVPVRTLEKAQLLALKLLSLCDSPRALDFFDIWAGLKSEPEIYPKIQSIWRDTAWGKQSFLAARPFRSVVALDYLNGLQHSWHRYLGPWVTSVPDFDQVRCNLHSWLPALDAEKV